MIYGISFWVFKWYDDGTAHESTEVEPHRKWSVNTLQRKFCFDFLCKDFRFGRKTGKKLWFDSVC